MGDDFARQEGNKANIAAGLGDLADMVMMQGDYTRAAALLEESLEIWRQLGDKGNIAWVLSRSGDLARIQNQYAQAKSLYIEALALEREASNLLHSAFLHLNLGYVLKHEGDYAQARTLFELSLTLYRNLEDKRGIASSLSGLASLAYATGQAERSARLLGAAEGLLQQAGDIWQAANKMEHQRNLAALGNQGGAAYAEGQAMTLEQVIAYALHNDQTDSI
jgi:tetratricopeptide (TPR) repeat protein